MEKLMEKRIKIQYFINENKNGEDIWIARLVNLIDYFTNYKKIPSSDDSDENIRKLSEWINIQHINYDQNINTMVNPKIRDIWMNFKSEFNEYLMNKEERWRYMLVNVQEIIDDYDRLPSNNIDEEKHLYKWLKENKKNGKIKKDIHKNEEIHREWKDFLNYYNKYFKKYMLEENTVEKILKYIIETKTDDMTMVNISRILEEKLKIKN